MQKKPLLTAVRATNSNNNRLYNSSAGNTVLTCLSYNWPMWHFVLISLLVTLAATLCHFNSFMEHLSFIIPVQFNVFLPCVFPCTAATTVGINKVSCLVQKKGLPFSYLDSSKVIKVKIETCMRCFALTAAWQGNSSV